MGAVFIAALAAPQAADAATTIGAPVLAGTPQPGSACPAPSTTCTTVLESLPARAPSAGVIVRWRVHALAGAQALTLRTARPVQDGWRAVATEATPRTIAGGAIETFPARLAIAAGDALAVEAASVPAARDPLSAGPLAVFAGPFADVARAPDATLTGGLMLQADVEADADGDGFGDESQDACPAEGDRQAKPCSAALSVAAVVAPQWGVVGEVTEHRYRVADAGPGAAADIVVRVAAAGGGRVVGLQSSRGTCSADACTIDELGPGDSADVVLTLTADAPSEMRSSATVSTASTDREPADDSAGAATMFTPPSVAPAPSVLPAPACANAKFGTNDDELLEGSGFGDRLVGRGGRDLIRGLGGDDCLEGGRGGDVLGGGFGKDRLAGGFGADRLYGDSGDDKLEGGLGNDALAGGVGADQLFPGRGADQVNGGPGNDTISARDRVRDRIDCGPGRDSARVDRRDRVRNCESVSRG